MENGLAELAAKVQRDYEKANVLVRPHIAASVALAMALAQKVIDLEERLAKVEGASHGE